MTDTTLTTDQQQALRAAFDKSQIGKLPKSGTTLDYVGHGAVTSRLLEVDPFWSWEPLAFDEHGLPRFTLDANGNPIAFWIRLTIGGVTRLGCGTCNAKQFDAEKVLIGDAIRNAAMRFGVALDLWIRGQGEDDEQRTNADTRQGPARRAEPPADQVVSAENARALVEKVEALGLSVAEVVKLGTDGRTDNPAEVLRSEVGAVKAAIDNLAPAPGEAVPE